MTESGNTYFMEEGYEDWMRWEVSRICSSMADPEAFWQPVKCPSAITYLRAAAQTGAL